MSIFTLGSGEAQAPRQGGADRAYHGAEEEVVQLDELRLIVFSDQHRGTPTEPTTSSAVSVHKPPWPTIRSRATGCSRWVTWRSFGRPAGGRPRPVHATLELGPSSTGPVGSSGSGATTTTCGGSRGRWRHLGRRLEGLLVREGLRLRILRGFEPLGELLSVHGHQGTLDADRFGWVSRLFVRYVAAAPASIGGWRPPPPSVDWKLRGEHDSAMCEWARGDREPSVVLVAGHTHRPVFAGSAPTPDARSRWPTSRRSSRGPARAVVRPRRPAALGLASSGPGRRSFGRPAGAHPA